MRTQLTTYLAPSSRKRLLIGQKPLVDRWFRLLPGTHDSSRWWGTPRGGTLSLGVWNRMKWGKFNGQQPTVGENPWVFLKDIWKMHKWASFVFLEKMGDYFWNPSFGQIKAMDDYSQLGDFWRLTSRLGIDRMLFCWGFTQQLWRYSGPSKSIFNIQMLMSDTETKDRILKYPPRNWDIP